MTVLKVVQNVTDYDHFQALMTQTYNEPERYDYVNQQDRQYSSQMSWPAPAGNTLWVHYRWTQSRNDTTWDEVRFFEFLDANGDRVLRFDVIDALHRWYLIGDTSPTVQWGAVRGVSEPWDVQFTKNGTTDLTVNIYKAGTLVGTMTAANTADKGVPVILRIYQTDGNSWGQAWLREFIFADEDTRGWRIRQHTPRAHGAERGWSGSATAFANSPNLSYEDYPGRDKYVYSNTLNQIHTFGVDKTDYTPEGITMEKIVLQTYGIRGSSGLAQFNPCFRWEDGTIVHDTDVSLALDQRLFISEYETSPDTSAAWTAAEIRGLQPGVRSRT